MIILDIFKDFFCGLLFSLRFDILLSFLIADKKLTKVFYKIVKCNFLLYFLPTFLIQILGNFLPEKLIYVINVISFINYPIDLFSFFCNLLHCLDLINVICTHTLKLQTNLNIVELISWGVIINIYQMCIFTVSFFVKFTFNKNFTFFAYILDFLILAVYHSFYCFNNLWHHKKIDTKYRIDIYEKLWPFFFGYGFVSTIIFNYTNNRYFLGLYNIYLPVLICLPFLTVPRYPKNETYPKINLSIFSHAVGLFVSVLGAVLK